MLAPVPVGPSPIESIRLVERFERPLAGFKFTATSLPGHLLHLVVAGEVEQSCNGRRQHLTPGALVWYHEDEWVEGRVLRAPWVYYSVNFSAPTLSPPDFAQRVRPGHAALASTFAALLTEWRAAPGAPRSLRSHAHLLTLLAALGGPAHRQAVVGDRSLGPPASRPPLHAG